MRWILGLAAVALAAAGAAASADAPTRTVTMPGKLYDPARVDVLVGTTVAWKNDDSINHTATAEDDSFASGYIPPGGTFSYTFTRQGRFEFRCTIHKLMRGEIDVFGLVLAGPEAPVTAGRRIVFAGLAPAGTASVTLHGIGPERSVKPRDDGSFALRFTITAPGSYRAVAGSLASPRVRVLVKPIVRATRSGPRAPCLDDACASRRGRRAPGLRPGAVRLGRRRTRGARSVLAGAARDPGGRRASASDRSWDEGLGRRRLTRRRQPEVRRG